MKKVTLEEIGQAFAGRAGTPPAGYVRDTGKPFWVVVVNPRRSAVQPKFHSGHDGEAEALTAAQKLQKVADKQAEGETAARRTRDPSAPAWEPYRYFVIDRPAGGFLEGSTAPQEDA